MLNSSAADHDPAQAPGSTSSLPEGLRGRAAREAMGHGLFFLLFFLLLDSTGAVQSVKARAIPAAGVLVGVHWFLWRNLQGNHPPGSSGIAPHLGTANRITLLRGLLISLVAGFLCYPSASGLGGAAVWVWLPGTLYLTAAVLDVVDGIWARRTGTQTALGQTLDVNTDALGVLVASAVAASSHRLPAYYLAAGAAYYLYQFGLWYRRCRGKKIHSTGSRTFARLIAGFQMGFLGIALLPIFNAKILEFVAPVFLLPLLAGFVWDWGVVRGCVSDVATRRCETLVVTLSAKGPPILRVGILIAGGGMLLTLPVAPFSGSILIPFGLGLMVVAGFMGRTAALLLSLLLAHQASVSGASPFLMMVLIGSLLIMLAGTGDGSLWRPEDGFLLGKPGGPMQS